MAFSSSARIGALTEEKVAADAPVTAAHLPAAILEAAYLSARSASRIIIAAALPLQEMVEGLSVLEVGHKGRSGEGKIRSEPIVALLSTG